MLLILVTNRCQSVGRSLHGAIEVIIPYLESGWIGGQQLNQVDGCTPCTFQSNCAGTRLGVPI